jgi:hypothetical protein
MVSICEGGVYVATRNIMTRRRLSGAEPCTGITDRELWEALHESFSMDQCTQGLEAKHEDPFLKLDAPSSKAIQMSFAEKLLQTDRETLDVSVKLFLYHSSCDVVSLSLHQVMKELGTNFLDTVILSKTDQASLDSGFVSYWAVSGSCYPRICIAMPCPSYVPSTTTLSYFLAIGESSR